MNQKKESYTRSLTDLSVAEFKAANPDLDVTKLTPTYPASLDTVKLSQKKMAQTGINPVTLAVVCGTVFGDASLAVQTHYSNARLQYRHSTRQTEWFMWKTFCALQEFITDNSIQFQMPDGFQRKTEAIGGETLGKWKVSTLVSDKLTKVRNEIAPNNIKTIKRDWLNHMNDYFLMTLWLDDGSLSKGRQGVISCHSTPLSQAKILADYIKTVWGVDCRAEICYSKSTPTNPEPSQIVIVDLDNLQKLLRIIAPIVPVKSMLYKICLFPEDREILQRWTSEVKTLVRPEFSQELVKYSAYLGALKEQEERKAANLEKRNQPKRQKKI
jgi:hypothetical protein